jgi:hypothetical protein
VQRDARLLLGGGILGVMLGFLFDPRSGRRRRALARDRGAGAVRRGVRRTRREARLVAAYAVGRARRSFHRRPPERDQPDDATLTQKLETELFRPADVPKGQINVNVQNGVVQLRGEVPRPEMIADLVARAGSVAGVRDVENLLHLPGSPAPMHQ